MAGYGRAFVWIPEQDFWKVARGIALPDGYELLSQIPVVSSERMSIGFLIESREIPDTPAAHVLPSLSILPAYQSIVVERWIP